MGLVTIIHIHCTYFLYMLMYVSFTYPYMCCFFSLFIHILLITCMQSIISVSHKDALMSFFFLKCFRNTGCQSLLAINSLLAKFFKSLCEDRFYCIQQVNMSWVIYDFSHILFVCCGFVIDCQMGRLLGHMWFTC